VGRRNGRDEEFSTTFADRDNEGARYIEQLWAARKAGALSKEIRLRGQTRELMDALKQLALRYGFSRSTRPISCRNPLSRCACRRGSTYAGSGRGARRASGRGLGQSRDPGAVDG